MSEIALRQPMTFPQRISYAGHLAESNMLPQQYRKNPANVLFALEYADALGLPAISAITSIYVVEGKPTASADLIASLVRKAGHRLRVSGDDTYAVAQIIRADDPDFTYEARWDMNKARAAGLAGKGVWRSYPAAMLRSRAITEVARMGASDALYGCIYTPEELGADVNGDGDVIAAPSSRLAPAQDPPRSAADRVRASIRPTPTPEPEPEPDRVTGDVVDGEVVPDPISKAQLTALNAGLTSLGYRDRPAIYALLTAELARPIGSSAEVTRDEASQLLDRLRRGDIPAPTLPEPEPAATSAPTEADDTFVEEPPADWTPEP